MTPLNRAFAVAAIAVVALALAWMLRAVLPVIAIALLYAIVTWPLVRRFERRMTRSIAIMAVDVGIALILAGAAVLIGPAFFAQAQALAAALPHSTDAALGTLPAGIRENIAAAIAQLDISFAAISREAIGASFALLRSASAIAAALIVIPVLAAYFQMDQQRYESMLFSLVPEEHGPRVRRALPAIARAVGGFVRGQLIVSGIVGLLIYIVLLVCGVQYAASIAVLTAIFDLVPYLGGVVAFVPSLLLALTAGGIGKAVLVAVLIAAVFELEAQVLNPQIVGSGTELPPSTVIVALLVGTALFGVLGLYLAVPFTAALGAAMREMSSAVPPLSAASSRPRVRATPPSH
jgi:predicted PurR-regulated permease PerM